MPDSDTLTARESWQTPEQHAAAREFRHAHDSSKRKLNDFLRFWKFCASPTCRRAHGCRGNPHTCFGVFWPHVPEDIKSEVRALICEAAGKHEEAQRHRTRAARPAEAESRTAEPDVAPPRDAHMPRIRTL